MKEKPIKGSIVHYVLPPRPDAKAGDPRPECESRPAMVVDVTTAGLSLQVFTDGERDRPALAGSGEARWGEPVPALLSRDAVKHDESGKPGTWHWPPKEGSKR